MKFTKCPFLLLALHVYIISQSKRRDIDKAVYTVEAQRVYFRGGAEKRGT